MKKLVLLTVACLVMLPICANAEVDSQYTSSTQFLTNIGYSPEAGRIVEVHTVDPYAPINEKKLSNSEKFWRVINYFDAVDYDNWDFPSHRTVHGYTWFTDY